MTLRELSDADHAACEAILRGLPEWFGIEESLVAYVEALARFDGWVIDDGGGVAAFLAVEQHNVHSAEIHVMAVLADRHGRGHGRALVEHVERELRARGTVFLHVKTLGPSRPCAFYERTRAFYRRVGFLPLEENALWGEANPCLFMVKALELGGVETSGEVT